MEDRVAGSLSTEKGLMSESISGLLNLLSVDPVDDEDGKPEAGPNPFVDRLISNWMDKHHINSDGGSSDHIEMAIRASLVGYGKRKPKVRNRHSHVKERTAV
jgi:hypothetical protein